MAVQEEFGRDVRIIGMPGASDDPAAMMSFVESTRSSGITHIPDLDGSVWDRFDGAKHRLYIYIDDDGTSRIGGYGNLRAAVEDLIAQ